LNSLSSTPSFLAISGIGEGKETMGGAAPAGAAPER